MHGHRFQVRKLENQLFNRPFLRLSVFIFPTNATLHRFALRSGEGALAL